MIHESIFIFICQSLIGDLGICIELCSWFNVLMYFASQRGDIGIGNVLCVNLSGLAFE
jgi:hypothetical protein